MNIEDKSIPLTLREQSEEWYDKEANMCEKLDAMREFGKGIIYLHYISWKHLHRYLAEFSTRWNMLKTDGADRLDLMLESSSGCRLDYRSLIA